MSCSIYLKFDLNDGNAMKLNNNYVFLFDFVNYKYVYLYESGIIREIKMNIKMVFVYNNYTS